MDSVTEQVALDILEATKNATEHMAIQSRIVSRLRDNEWKLVKALEVIAAMEIDSVMWEEQTAEIRRIAQVALKAMARTDGGDQGGA